MKPFWRIGLPMAVALVLTAIWIALPASPAELSFCLKTRGPATDAACIESVRLSIPGKFKADGLTDDWYQMELAYPSMEPWSSLPWFGTRDQQRITINLRGRTAQTVADIVNAHFLGSPKPVPQAPLYGLRQYLLEGWGTQQILIPQGSNPPFVLVCAFAPDLSGRNPKACKGTTFTDWQLKIEYFHKRALIPDTPLVRAKVIAFVNSLKSQQ